MRNYILCSSDIPTPNGGAFFWECVKEFLTWDLIVPGVVIGLIFFISYCEHNRAQKGEKKNDRKND